MDITVNNLSYSYEQENEKFVQILDKLNFSIKKGEFVVILGESGCGKSTILELLAGLIQPTDGSVLVNEKTLTNTIPEIALLFQVSTLLPWKNVRENIAFGCKIRKDVDNLDERVNHYMSMMGLMDYQSYYPQELSVGMSKRVDLARALLGKPNVLLLDEPFAPLDYFNKIRLQSELLSIWQSEGLSCVLVTHDVEEALLLGQKIMIMSNNPGRIEFIQHIDLDYPRVVTRPEFVNTKKELLIRFGKISSHYKVLQ